MMRNSRTGTDDPGIADRLEAKARELETYSRETTSRIIRAVSQGQAQILREFAADLAGTPNPPKTFRG